MEPTLTLTDTRRVMELQIAVVDQVGSPTRIVK